MKKSLLYFVFVLALAAAAPAQINPRTQIRWPANCNVNAGMVYNLLLNTCIPAGGGGSGGGGGFSIPAAGGAWAFPPALDPTGVADNSSAVNGYIAALVANYYGSSSVLALPPGKFYVPSLSNIYGVPITGSGILLKQINQNNNIGTATQGWVTSYAYMPPRLVLGLEYAGHWFSNIEGALSTTAIFSGDSTTQSGNNVSGSYTVDQLFLTSAKQAGINVLAVTNAGHSGKTTADWLNSYLATDQSANPDIYFIRFGINDPSQSIPPAQFIANIRQGLACIRNGCSGVTAKTVDQETIVLEMPSSTNDYYGNRSPLSYEQYRNGMVQAARDYRAVFIDLYGAMPDNDYAVQTCMMDLPYTTTPQTPPIHIHPGPCKAIVYNDMLAKALIDPLKVVTGGSSSGGGGGGSGQLPSNVMEACGNVTFSASATSPTLPCSWVTTSSSCTASWIGTNVSGGVLAVSPTLGNVQLTAANSNSSTAAVACSISASGGSVSVVDHFSGSTGTNLTAHPTDYGQSWLKAWNTTWGAALTLTGSNATTNTTTSFNGGGYYVNVTPSSWDYTVTVTCTLNTSGDECSALGRASSSVLTFYQADFTNGQGVKLMKFVGGTATQLGTLYTGVTSGTHTIALQMVGSQISVLVDGTQQVATQTDTSVTTGFPGMELATKSSQSIITYFAMQ